MILYFYLSFCFLIFDILFLVRRLKRSNKRFSVNKHKFANSSYHRGFYG